MSSMDRPIRCFEIEPRLFSMRRSCALAQILNAASNIESSHANDKNFELFLLLSFHMLLGRVDRGLHVPYLPPTCNGRPEAKGILRHCSTGTVSTKPHGGERLKRHLSSCMLPALQQGKLNMGVCGERGVVSALRPIGTLELIPLTPSNR